MPSHKHSVGLPVILLDTLEVGTVNVQLPPQAGKTRYQIGVHGRPAIPGRPQGPAGNRNVDEEIIGVGMTTSEKAIADGHLRDSAIRGLSSVERDVWRSTVEGIRDAASSSDHQINEAIRVIDAIDFIEAQ